MFKIPKKAERRANVLDHHYDPETGNLTVMFHDGRRYQYSSVPAGLAEDMSHAISLGSFLHKHVIGKYTHTLLPHKHPLT